MNLFYKKLLQEREKKEKKEKEKNKATKSNIVAQNTNEDNKNNSTVKPQRNTIEPTQKVSNLNDIKIKPAVSVDETREINDISTIEINVGNANLFIGSYNKSYITINVSGATNNEETIIFKEKKDSLLIEERILNNNSNKVVFNGNNVVISNNNVVDAGSNMSIGRAGKTFDSVVANGKVVINGKVGKTVVSSGIHAKKVVINGKKVVINDNNAVVNSKKTNITNTSNKNNKVHVNETLKITIQLPNKLYNLLKIKGSTPDINIVNVNSNEIRISSSTGDIKVNSYFSIIEISTSTGDVNLTTKAQNDISVEIKTSTGDVNANITNIGNMDADYKSSTGDINDYFEEDGNFDAEVSITTSTGDITIGN